MLRTFIQHRVRSTQSLDGFWDFTTQEAANKPRLPKAYARRIHVPSCWETLPGMETYRGQAWLRTSFDGVPGHASRIVFAGVSHTAKVYVDGKAAGSHYDAFTPWSVLSPNAQDTGHELSLLVDNSFSDQSSLHIPNDYYTYGGITRPVELQHVPEVFIERVHATPALTSRTGQWILEVSIRLRNWSKSDLLRQVTVTVGDLVQDLGLITVPAGAARQITRKLTVPNVEAWSPDNPRLYELTTELYHDNAVVDDLIERIGFRTVAVKGKQILLNGQPIRMRGYNRHEDHPNFGCAIPLPQMVQDLEIMRDLGCNYVRTSHYPNDQRFLDLCDEMGFLVWEESHARTVDLQHPKFREQIEGSTREMIDWHYNHPSIIMWGCLNECETRTPEGRTEYAWLIKLFRQLDSSRPITYASMFHEQDICFHLADIVSVNIYTGWYKMNLDDVKPRLDRFIKWLDTDKKSGGKGKPLIISEFGGGAIPGYTSPTRCPWSEEYLSDMLEHELSVYLNHPRVVGALIWQFCDVRVTPEGNWWRQRPRTMNNKGTVNQFRQPKMCYAAVKRQMLAAKAKDAKPASRKTSSKKR